MDLYWFAEYMKHGVCHPNRNMHLFKEDEFPIVIADALSQIDIGVVLLPINIRKLSPQHRNVIVSFPVKADVVRTVLEAAASPHELT